MSVPAKEFLGLEINDRLRIVSLIEERPFAYLFEGEVLALSRVVGSCSVTVYVPREKADPDDIVSSLRSAGRGIDADYLYTAQQVGVLRHGELSGIVYSTGEPVTTTLNREFHADRLLGVEEGEQVALAVAKGLTHLHIENLVHGRVRPYHILKTGDGWKLAGHEMHELEEQLNRVCHYPEEPAFLPPENYKDGIFNAKVDAWALGIALHQTICGRLPYSGDEDLLDQVLKNPPRVERAPGRVGSVIRALLSSEPSDRWDLERSVAHIERPRDNNMGPAGSNFPGGQTTPGAGQVQNGQAEAAPDLGDRPKLSEAEKPLYARKAFLAFATACFIFTAVLGYRTGRLPDIQKENAPPEPLYSVDFFHTQIDPDGRQIDRKPEQAVAYAENLAPENRIEMVQVPPGTFQMGSDGNSPYADKAEMPKHTVQVGGFFISRFEITQQQWEAVASLPQVNRELPPKPSTFKGADRPVEGITWLEAKEFCARLSQRTNRLYRLPTEAEWEFACRAGTQGPFCFGKTIVSSLANYNATTPFAQEGRGQNRKETVSVGSLGAANYFGLLDVHGNVAEWCEDRFGDYSKDFIIDPTGSGDGKDRVVRGGGWKSTPRQIRAASRLGVHESYRKNDIGFRIVLPRVVMVPAPQR